MRYRIGGLIFGGAYFRNFTVLCFSKDRRDAYFCPTYIEGGVLSSIYGLDSICHLWSICITFSGMTIQLNMHILIKCYLERFASTIDPEI